MSNIILDIETAGLPDDSPLLKELIAEASPPSNYKSDEAIEKWRKGNAEKVKKATSFDAAYGRIVSAAWAIDDGAITCKCVQDESEIINGMFEDIAIYLGPNLATVVGHNLLGFDAPFLKKRCIILGIPLPQWFPRDLKPWSGDVFDTMIKWDSDKSKMISQTKLAKLLGIEVDESIDGSMIQGLWENGEVDKIYAYNLDDVRICREIHRKMSYVLGL